jgi:hypothetical protein
MSTESEVVLRLSSVTEIEPRGFPELFFPDPPVA